MTEKKKNYSSPEITAVRLDPQQAMLQVCAVGGVYVSNLGGSILCGEQGGMGARCKSSQKGGEGGNQSIISEPQQAAS